MIHATDRLDKSKMSKGQIFSLLPRIRPRKSDQNARRLKALGTWWCLFTIYDLDYSALRAEMRSGIFKQRVSFLRKHQ